MRFDQVHPGLYMELLSAERSLHCPRELVESGVSRPFFSAGLVGLALRYGSLFSFVTESEPLEGWLVSLHNLPRERDGACDRVFSL